VKVYVQGNAINLLKQNYLGGGGEGNVYVQGSTAYKVYHDPSKMLPLGKIHELQALTDPLIIKPEQAVKDSHGTPIGYTMRFVKDTHTLCELFPPAFRQRSSITPQMTLDLVLSLQERVRNTHKAGVLVVDLNEMNYLVDAGFTKVYAIDVDSYQTAHFPATAIMQSVRDPQVQNLDWTELSDWFSFACVAFNLFVGIHPYKGKHPSIKGFEDRMKAGASVFDSQVRVPRMVLPFTVIPDTYRAWFKAVLQDGKRLPPPGDLHGVLVVAPVVRLVAGTDKLDVQTVWDFPDTVRGLWDHEGACLVWTDGGLYLGNRRLRGPVGGIAGVGFTPRRNKPIVAGTSGGNLRLLDATTDTEVPVNLQADAVMSHGGHIYVRTGDTILEIILNDLGGNAKVLASTKTACTCMEHATRLFPGVAVQDLLGKTWVSLFPKSGWTHQIALPELDEYRITEAKYDNAPGRQAETGVLMVTGVKGGQTDRLVFRFDSSFKTYDVRKVEDVVPTGLNFVVLDTGVCICMTEEEKLEVFSVRRGSTGMKVVDDPTLAADMRLHRQGVRVVLPRRNRVQSMRLK